MYCTMTTCNIIITDKLKYSLVPNIHSYRLCSYKTYVVTVKLGRRQSGGTFGSYVHLCKWLFFCVTYSEVMIIYQLFFMNFLSFNKRLKEKGKKQRIEGKTMPQWINLLRYNSFVNGQWVPLLCEKLQP